MDYPFLNSLNATIMEVVVRDAEYWRTFQYRIDRTSTQLHSLALVIEGEGALQVDGDDYILEAGSLFQVAPGMKLQVKTQPDKMMVFYSFHYQGWVIEAPASQKHRPLGKLPLPIHMPLQDWKPLQDMFLLGYRTWKEKSLGYDWKCKLQFLHVLGEIHRLESFDHSKLDGIQNVKRVIEYMNQHFTQPLDRVYLAELASLSPSYFSTLFKQYTGMSPIEYMNKMRIHRAKQLLRSSKLNIAEVAGDVGYEDAFYFSRVFARETGYSPSEYRKG